MPGREVLTDFGPIAGISASFLIDKEGNVFKKNQAHMKYNQLAADIEQLLAE